MAKYKDKKKAEEEKEQYTEQKKQTEWKDLNEKSKYICEKGIISCKYCSIPDAKIKVTSNNISLQDSPWVTAGDNNGKVNFLFQGICKKVPGSNKPPCLQVINLQGWQKTSKTFINNDLALRMDSFNMCAISNDKLFFKNSGQYSELGGLQDALTDGGQYFVEAKWTRDPQTKYQIRDTLNNSVTYFCIEMQNTEHIADKVIDIKLFDAYSYDKPLPITRKNSNESPYYNIVDNKVIAGFNLSNFEKQTSQIFAICNVRDENGNLETVRLPTSEKDYLTVHPIVCIDRYKLIGLNPLGTDIANDMTFGYTVKTPLDILRDQIRRDIEGEPEKKSEEDPEKEPQLYTTFEVRTYIEEFTEAGFQEPKHLYYANEVEGNSEDEHLQDYSPEDYIANSPEDYTLHSDKTTVATKPIPQIDLQAALSVSTKMRYDEERIKSANYKGIPTGRYVWAYKEYVEYIIKNRITGIFLLLQEDNFETFTSSTYIPLPVLREFYIGVRLYTLDLEKYYQLTLGNIYTVKDFLFHRFRKLVGQWFDFGELEGNIGKMIDKFEASQGGIFETEQLSESLAKNPSTDRYCAKIHEYIEHIMYENKGDIANLIDNKVYFDDGGEDGSDSKLREEKKKNFGGIAFTWSMNSEGLANVFGGRTIALNDIWAREIYLQSVSWTDEFHYKVQYKIILWDHFGLDLPDLEKEFNFLPIAREIFACWFLLQHCYGYRPFITKASFVKEFEGDIRISSKNNKIIQDQLETDKKRKEGEQKAMESILQSKNIWNLKW